MLINICIMHKPGQSVAWMIEVQITKVVMYHSEIILTTTWLWLQLLAIHNQHILNKPPYTRSKCLSISSQLVIRAVHIHVYLLIAGRIEAIKQLKDVSDNSNIVKRVSLQFKIISTPSTVFYYLTITKSDKFICKFSDCTHHLSNTTDPQLDNQVPC